MSSIGCDPRDETYVARIRWPTDLKRFHRNVPALSTRLRWRAAAQFREPEEGALPDSAILATECRQSKVVLLVRAPTQQPTYVWIRFTKPDLKRPWPLPFLPPLDRRFRSAGGEFD
jgi:hypothetical protein